MFPLSKPCPPLSGLFSCLPIIPGMNQKRVHILSAVNAANVSKDGNTYTIRDVVGALDDIVMNGRLYPADQLAAGVNSLEGKPAPAGHPKSAEGKFISALNGEALASAWIGSYVRNARHEGGRTMVDVVVNEAQAKAHPDGAKLVERLDAAIAGTNSDPIHVSTGLMMQPITANGESRGKKYSSIVTNIQYDHLAILLNERGAATPDEGVGMFVNADGEQQVESVIVNTEPEDRRTRGLIGWIKKLIGNEDDLSFDQIHSGLQSMLPAESWIREVYSKNFIWSDKENRLWRQDYNVSSDSSLSFVGEPVEVQRQVKYEPIEKETDPMKDAILAALNAAGISVAGLDDSQLLAAYNSLQAKPLQEAVNAANSKLAEIEAASNAAKTAELDALAQSLAVNSVLTADDLKALGLDRLKAIKAATAGAAPVLAGNSATKPASEFAGYSINSHLEA